MAQYLIGGTILLGGGYLTLCQSNIKIYPLLTKFIGYGTIYYNQIYDRYIVDNNIKIVKLLLNNKEISESEFTKIKCYEKLEIKYNQMNKMYSIVLFDNQVNCFPPYLNKEIEKLDSFSITDSSIILVNLIKNDTEEEIELDNEKLLEIVKEYSGPKGNFYKDKIVNFQEYKYKLRKYLIKLYDSNFDNHRINIMYSDGNTLIL